MKNKILKSIIAVLLLSSALLICNPVNAESKNALMSDSDRSKQIEHRIDKLTMLIADKNEEGIDTTNAENLLLEAIDLLEENKIDESLEKLKGVVKSLGMKPVNFREKRKPGMMGEFQANDQKKGNFSKNQRQKRRPFIKVEMSESEKKAALSEIKDLLSSTQGLIEEGKLEDAFKKLSDAHRMLADVTGMRPPFMDGAQRRMGPGGFGPRDGFGPGQQGGQQDGQRNSERGFMGGRPNGQDFKKGQGPDIEKIFERAREHGEEGFDRLSENFENLLDRLKGRGVEYNTEAEDYYHKAVKFNENDDLDSAFENLQEAFELIKNSTDRSFSPGGPGMRGGPGQDQKRGNKLNSEEFKRVKDAAASLKDVYKDYITKNDRDEFIETCFDDFNDIRKKLKRGEIEIDDAVKMINALTKKIEENI